MNPLNQIYLASSSPRRRELLEQIGIDYQLVAVDVDETVQMNERAEQYVVRLSIDKAMAGWHRVGHGVVIGADTAVVIDGTILGKPKDRDDFFQMFSMLAGHTHQVMSGVALVGGDERMIHRLCVSHVTFRQMSPSEIESYWQSGEPTDKAGGYGIQGMAAAYIRHLDGSYSGVMGLPLFELMELMAIANQWPAS